MDFGHRRLPTQTCRRFDGAAFGVEQGRMGAPLGPDAGLAETTDREVHEPRISPLQGHVAEPACGEHTGSEILDEDVTLLGQAGHQLRTRGCADVRADMALSGVHLRVQGTDAVDDRRHGPAEVAPGRFDLHDLGARGPPGHGHKPGRQ